MITGLWQKLGFWPNELIKTWKSKKGWVWIHAVSVGELKAVWPLILKINQHNTQRPIMLSCTTKAGYTLAKELAKDTNFVVFFFPFDIPIIINSLLNYAQIKLLIIVETEIWPNVLKSCHKNNIPIILVNGRLSEKSFRNYMLFRFYFKNIVNLFSEILAQSEPDANKFKTLGVESKKIKVLGNIKYSTIKNNNNNTNEKNGKDGKNKKTTNDKSSIVTIIFASTHKNEEEIALLTYKRLMNDYPNLRLIIAPRHIDRIKEIVNLHHRFGFTPILRTENLKVLSNKEILIINTIGELQDYFNVSDITVLGGTFVKVGGHNILEPIRANSLTIIGPYDYKITELTTLFKSRNAIIQVKDPEELLIKLKEYISNSESRENIIKNGISILNENTNVLEQTTQQILSYIQ